MSDYDQPSAWWVTEPVARKQHECCECDGGIHPGEGYRRAAGVWSGEFSHYKTCFACVELGSRLTSAGFEHCLGGLYEALEEAQRDGFVIHPLEQLAIQGI